MAGFLTDPVTGMDPVAATLANPTPQSQAYGAPAPLGSLLESGLRNIGAPRTTAAGARSLLEWSGLGELYDLAQRERYGQAEAWEAPLAGAMAFVPGPKAGGVVKAGLRRNPITVGNRTGLDLAAPDRTTYSLMRKRAPKGTSKRLANLIENLDYDRLRGFAESGARQGGLEWYDTEDILKEFQDVLGPEEGMAAWERYIDLVAATSTGAKVPANAKVASHYFTQGPGWVQDNMAELIDAAIVPPKGSGYGHKMQRAHATNVGRQARGDWGPTGLEELNPKPRGFGQSLKGSRANIAADKHFVRLLGMLSGDPDWLHGSADIGAAFGRELLDAYPKAKKYIKTRTVDGKPVMSINAKKAVREGAIPLDALRDKPVVWAEMPEKNEYKAMEELMRDLADAWDMTPAQLQASLWVGGAPVTGVDPTSNPPFKEIFRGLVRKAASDRELPEQEVFRRFATGQQALTPLLGAAGLGTAAGVGAGGLLGTSEDQL